MILSLPQFEAYPAGTYWYHSHSSSQTSEGMNGGFVVHPRQGPGSGPEYQEKQFTLVVKDYNHEWEETMAYLKMQVKREAEGRLKKIEKFHFINPKGKFILSPRFKVSSEGVSAEIDIPQRSPI